MLANEPRFEEVVDELLPFFEDAIIVATMPSRHGVPPVQAGPHGTPSTLQPRPRYAGSGPGLRRERPYTLGILANRLGIEGPHAHRALEDARMAPG